METGIILSGDSVKLVVGIVGVATVFAGIVAERVKTKSEVGNLTNAITKLNERITSMKTAQKVVDKAQNEEIKEVARNQHDLNNSITQVHGKLDVLTAILEERLPNSKE